MSDILDRLNAVPKQDIEAIIAYGGAELTIKQDDSLGDYIKLSDLILAIKDIEQIIDDNNLEIIASNCR
jgi:high-affinity Fe2+/Pb2+ permease